MQHRAKKRVAIAALAMLIASPGAAQDAGQAVNRLNPEHPKTWTLEYPAVIGSFVEDYYGCLKSGGHVIGGGETFESQHRADFPRCAAKGDELMAEANRVLARRKMSDETTPQDVATIFETVRQIHLERGRDIDDQFKMRLATKEPYQEPRLQPGETGADECIARIHDLIDARQAYADQNAADAEAIFKQDDFTDEDRRALATYQLRLRRYTDQITLEMQSCPAAMRLQPSG